MEQGQDPNFKDWWNESIHWKTRDKWKPALEDYLDFHNIPVTHEKFSLEFVKRIIPHVGHYDERWKRFPVSSYDPDVYNAHLALG